MPNEMLRLSVTKPPRTLSSASSLTATSSLPKGLGRTLRSRAGSSVAMVGSAGCSMSIPTTGVLSAIKGSAKSMSSGAAWRALNTVSGAVGAACWSASGSAAGTEGFSSAGVHPPAPAPALASAADASCAARAFSFSAASLRSLRVMPCSDGLLEAETAASVASTLSAWVATTFSFTCDDVATPTSSRGLNRMASRLRSTWLACGNTTISQRSAHGSPAWRTAVAASVCASQSAESDCGTQA